MIRRAAYVMSISYILSDKKKKEEKERTGEIFKT